MPLAFNPAHLRIGIIGLGYVGPSGTDICLSHRDWTDRTAIRYDRT